MKKVSVVILNWNGVEMLRTFLPSVIENTNPLLADVCVADNGSTDNSVEILQSEFPTVRLIRLDENYGFAEGYNKVMDFVDTEYVVLLNSDVEVTDSWIEPILEYMDENPEVAACQPKILSYRNKDLFEYAGASGGFIDKYGYPFCRGRVFDTVEADNGQYNDIIDIFWASGAAMFVRRNLYKSVGGLDGKFFAHMEEIDLCWRFLSRGYRVVCVPSSTVYHVGGATLKKENPRKTYLNFRNNLLMLYKNLLSHELKSVMRVRCALDYMAALFFVLKCDFANAKAVIKARQDYLKLCDEFQSLRQCNLKEATVGKIKYRYNFSIIFRCKLSGKKTYTELTR